jgi:UDP-N-acetylglucosamine:LPS N-acetylglucosamine transferase
MGRICSSVARDGSRIAFRWMPRLFDLQYWLITKFAPTRWLTHQLSYALGRRGLLAAIAEHDPDVIVSTYPGVTAVLGMLRQKRRLAVPVHSAITDLAGLRYWVHPGVDLHYVTHPESIEEVESLAGPASVEWLRPPISPEFLMPRTRADARRALDVPPHSRLVLVSGGGWGIGDLESAVRAALSGEDTMVVCITGRNEAARRRLEQRFEEDDRVRVLGFTERMSDWPRLSARLLRLLSRPSAGEQHRL